jgi:hypothetical protein
MREALIKKKRERIKISRKTRRNRGIVEEKKD